MKYRGNFVYRKGRSCSGSRNGDQSNIFRQSCVLKGGEASRAGRKLGWANEQTSASCKVSTPDVGKMTGMEENEKSKMKRKIMPKLSRFHELWLLSVKQTNFK